eukprot:1095234-Prorocentrum_lima.AAC.1
MHASCDGVAQPFLPKRTTPDPSRKLEACPPVTRLHQPLPKGLAKTSNKQDCLLYTSDAADDM